MNKRGIVSLLALLMTFMLVLAGCGSGGKVESSPTPKSEGSGSALEPSEKPVKKSIHILNTQGGSSFPVQGPEAERAKYTDELSRLSGYDLKYEFLGHNEDFKQQLSLRFVSGELADVLWTHSINADFHRGALDQNQFLELGPLIDEYGLNLKEIIPEAAWNSPKVSKDGKIYAIPKLNYLKADRIAFIRQDWLDQLNMKVPETIEDFLEYAEAVKNNDMNGDGNPDNEYALSLSDNLAWTDIFTGSFGVRPGTWHFRDGKLQPDVIQPEMKEAIAFYKTMYDNGYIPKDFATRKQSDTSANYKKGYFGTWGAAINQVNGWHVNNPEIKLTIMSPPKGPRGENGFSLENDMTNGVWVIPAKTENPEEIIKFLDWAFSSPEAEDFFAFGIEGHNYTIENGKIVYDPTAEVNTKDDVFNFYQTSLNFRNIAGNSTKVIGNLPAGEQILEGIKIAEGSMQTNDAMYMPALTSLDGKPDLAPNFGASSMFYNAFVKMVMGVDDLNQGFDKFVQDWLKHGGEAAIQEATEWYNSLK